ncbi:hypothetical protein LJB76_01345 [Clostridia bacterium OttesenSCG-928-O13]|nr:hypothetical protein [Clostridia bacterium OttesenSCG-928-O13]
MDLLFENHISVDKDVLLEWYKKDFRRNNPLFSIINGCMVGLYVFGAVAVAVLAVALRWPALWWFVLVFVLLAGLFLANLFLHYRLTVWTMLRRSKGRLFPQKLGTVFYADAAVPLSGDDQRDPAQRLARCMEDAQGLQAEFDEIMQRAGRADVSDADRLGELRDRLEDLKRRMDELTTAAAMLAANQSYPYKAMSGYQQTKNLHILYYGEQAILVAKEGFTQGNNKGFTAFMGQKVGTAAALAKDAKTRKRLYKALEEHFGAVGIIGGEAENKP